MEHTNFNNYPLVDLYSNFMMIFSRSLKMQQGYQLITTKYHMSYPLMCIDFKNLGKNLLSLGISEDILFYRIVSEDKFSTLNSTEKQIQVFNNPELLKLQFAIQTLPLSDLFNMSFFHNYILKCSSIYLNSDVDIPP